MRTPDFWNPIPLKPILSLVALRQVIIEHNERRMPIWKFRLASDLILRIQPQLTECHRDFHCKAIECAGVHAGAFAPRTERRSDQTNLNFDIYTGIPEHWLRRNLYPGLTVGQWTLKATSIGWSRKGKPNYDLAARLVRLLNDGQFDRIESSTLLSPQCLCCGKALTDPASMARLIGPECAQTSSLIIPFVWKALAEGQDSAEQGERP